MVKSVNSSITCGKYEYAINNEESIARNVEILCNTERFSKVKFQLEVACQNADLLVKCGLFNCIFDSNEKLDVSQRKNGFITVDLLRNPPSYTGYSENSKIIWMSLANLNRTAVYSYLLEAIKQSIDIHICKNHTRTNLGEFLNSKILGFIKMIPFTSKMCKKFTRSNMYRNLNAPYMSNLRKFRSRLNGGIKELKQAKYLLLFALCHLEQAGTHDITRFILFNRMGGNSKSIRSKWSSSEYIINRTIKNSFDSESLDIKEDDLKERYNSDQCSKNSQKDCSNSKRRTANQIDRQNESKTTINLGCYKFLDMVINSPILNGISRDLSKLPSILGCITCEKCRLWSLIQFNGLIATLKILQNNSITSTEYVYFINFLNKMIQAEQQYHNLKDMSKHFHSYMILLYSKEIFTIIIAVAIMYCLFIKE